MGYTEGFAVAEVKAMGEAATVKGEAARREAEAEAEAEALKATAKEKAEAATAVVATATEEGGRAEVEAQEGA